MTVCFTLFQPKKIESPIILSIPHSGVAYPKALVQKFLPQMVSSPPDCDWHVDQLYEFAHQLGIIIIKAHYCRYVVDLNRNPRGQTLYEDGRAETSVLPQFTFAGEPIYPQSFVLTDQEINSRLETYYWPYYRKIAELISDLKSTYPHVLLYDAHSIKRVVSTIRNEPFPCMILGDVDGTSAHPQLSQTALTFLQKSTYRIGYNDPFKGGQITRYFANPSQGIHCLQLEMSQDIYLNEATNQFDSAKALPLQSLLNVAMLGLGTTLLRQHL